MGNEGEGALRSFLASRAGEEGADSTMISNQEMKKRARDLRKDATVGEKICAIR